MQTGKKYIYSGITADSVHITVKVKKESTTNYTKILNDIAGIVSNEKISNNLTKFFCF